MPQSNPLLSVVVPTRNRERYAVPMIRSVLAIPADDLELVISDNGEEDLLARWVASQPSDARLRYRRISEPLSMTANHNQALSMARGEFVCLIGDDDTILPSILDACRWARRRELDAVTPGAPIRYCWPDFRHRYWGGRQAGRMYVDKWESRLWEGNPRAEAHASMRRAGQNTGWLPKVYHGLVRRSLLEELREETGAYCFSVSPDVYLALALGAKVARQVCTEAPLTIPGSSGGSNSGRAAMRRHKGSLRSDPHMVGYREEPWPQGNPAFFSVETVWAQAALEAVRRTQWTEMGLRFNYARLHAYCLWRHADRFGATWKAIASATPSRRPAAWSSTLLELGRISHAQLGYCARRLLRPTPRGYSQDLGRFADIHAARDFVVDSFREGLSWNPQVAGA